VKRLFSLAIIALVAAACGSKKSSSSGSMTCADAVTAWKKASLDVSDMKKADDLQGGKCQIGTVGGMETTTCDYGDAAAAKAATKAAYDRVGDATTGQSAAAGKCLVIVADRKNADPSGKKINAITAPFRAHP
jgi:hypothetical protein